MQLNYLTTMADKGNPYNMDSTSFDSERFLNKLLKVHIINNLNFSFPFDPHNNLIHCRK